VKQLIADIQRALQENTLAERIQNMKSDLQQVSP